MDEQYFNMMMQVLQNNTQYEEPIAETEEQESDYIKNLREFDNEQPEEDLSSQSRYDEVDAYFDQRLADLDEKLAMYELFDSGDGNDFLSMFFDPKDANDDVDVSVGYTGGVPAISSNIGQRIAAKESVGSGGYRAYNSSGGGEGAVGKYQFRWTQHKDKIRKYANNPNLTKEQFMDNPELQDSFFENEWIPKYITQDVNTLRKEGLGKNLSDEDMQTLVHYQGLGRSRKYLKGELSDKPESYNMPISKYMSK